MMTIKNPFVLKIIFYSFIGILVVFFFSSMQGDGGGERKRKRTYKFGDAAKATARINKRMITLDSIYQLEGLKECMDLNDEYAAFLAKENELCTELLSS